MDFHKGIIVQDYFMATKTSFDRRDDLGEFEQKMTLNNLCINNFTIYV